MAILIWLIVAEWLYVRALRVLGGRGVRVPRAQIACWHVGLGLQAVALLSPLGSLADDLLSAHMAEHLLLADLGAPLLLAGLRNPVLGFFLPRPVLVGVARRRRLRGAFRFLRRPLVAIPVYTLVLYGWHLTFAFEGAVRHDLVHVAQHASFIFAGIIVWWPALEPKRRRLRGELWKIGHIIAARMIGMFLGMALRADPRADLHGRVRQRRAARDRRARRPADGGRDDGRARHPDHGLRAGVLLLARRAAARPRRGRRAGPRGYLTVSLPSMPPSRWPGTEQ